MPSFISPGATPQERLRLRQAGQRLPRTGVRAVLHGAHLRVRHPAQVRPLGQVPPHQHPCFGPGPDPGFSFGPRATGSGFRAPLSTGGRRAGRRGQARGAAGRSARRRASAGGGHRPVLPHAPVAQEDVRGHDGPAHDRGHGGPGCLALSRSRPYGAFISGPDMQAAIAAMHGTSPGRLRPPPIWRPPFRVPLSRAKGATPPGAAAWRLPMAPGPPVQATGTPP